MMRFTLLIIILDPRNCRHWILLTTKFTQVILHTLIDWIEVAVELLNIFAHSEYRARNLQLFHDVDENDFSAINKLI